MTPDQKDAHAQRMLDHLEQQAEASQLPESVTTRMEKMLSMAPLMTPAELREYVVLLCEVAYHEGAMSMAEQVKGATAP
jgi:hypothetical protein